MTRPDPVRLVFSTEKRSICATCSRPASECACGARPDEPLPKRMTAKLRLETKARGGKSVTVIDGLPRNEPFLAELAQTLKKACGTGGTVTEGTIELQGDRRERLRALLTEKNFIVKG